MGSDATVPDRSEVSHRGMPEDQDGKILIVEDDPLVASYIADVLHESKFQVAGVASSGAEALSVARETRPEIALIDIRIAGPMDGIEVAGALREQFGIGAIFLTGMDDPSVAQRAKAAGSYGFLLKPFLPSQMYKTLALALWRHRRERE